MGKETKTKIVCTLGPASWDKEVLKRMIDNGMTVARVNASFADDKEIHRIAKLVRGLSKDVALMLDTKGHKIRVSDFPEPIHLKKNDTFVLESRENKEYIWVTYKGLYKQVEEGTKLLLDDGKIELLVTGVDGTKIITKVINGGILERSKTVNVIGTHLPFPCLTKKDKRDIESAMDAEYDFVSASFVRDVRDIKAIEKVLKDSEMKIIAKIENFEGVENLKEIIDRAYGVMVARGDLGVELPYEQTPLLQKQIVRMCNELGKPVIVATQMLESMISNPRPTRAEVSDITNAVIDGADAIMLSAETSKGDYPVKCVEVMSRVSKYVEAFIDSQVIDYPARAKAATNAIAEGVMNVCNTLDITKIIVATGSGTTARVISRHRPAQEIIAFTKDEYSKRSLGLTKGVIADVWPDMSTKRGGAVISLIKEAYKRGYVNKKDYVVVVSGANVEKVGATNMLEVSKVNEIV